MYVKCIPSIPWICPSVYLLLSARVCINLSVCLSAHHHACVCQHSSVCLHVLLRGGHVQVCIGAHCCSTDFLSPTYHRIITIQATSNSFRIPQKIRLTETVLVLLEADGWGLQLPCTHTLALGWLCLNKGAWIRVCSLCFMWKLHQRKSPQMKMFLSVILTRCCRHVGTLTCEYSEKTATAEEIGAKYLRSMWRTRRDSRCVTKVPLGLRFSIHTIA